MDLALAASLAALALIDSTSFGTLLIPIWLLLAPGRVRAGRMLVYLGTIAVFYFAVGMAHRRRRDHLHRRHRRGSSTPGPHCGPSSPSASACSR